MSDVDRLEEVLGDIGKPTFRLGSEILVLPYCGRVLALGPGGGDNCLWVNPALGASDTATAWLNGSGWLNPGGDRVWISPELETHVADPARYADTYKIAADVDPGNYIVEAHDGAKVLLKNACRLPFMRSGCTIELEWSLTIERLTQPFAALPAGVHFCGYRTIVDLHATGPSSGGKRSPQPSVWRLLQVPSRGTIDVPTLADPPVQSFIGNPTYTRTSSGVSCQVKTPASFKFGVHVSHAKNMLLYRRQIGEQTDLIVRRFQLDREARYSDVSAQEPDATGFVVQVYVDDGGYGEFGELEHHAPAIDLGMGEGERVDTSETWAFRGTAEGIDEMVRSALESC